MLKSSIAELSSLQSQIDGLRKHLQEEQFNYPVKNKDTSKFARLLLSFMVSTQGIDGRLQFSSNDLYLFQTIECGIREYLQSPLHNFPYYLFQLINGLDEIEGKK